MALKLLVARLKPATRFESAGRKPFSTGSPIVPSYNLNTLEDRILFYNEQRKLFPRDPQGMSYWRYLVHDDIRPEDLNTEIGDTPPSRRCLLATEASLLPKRILTFEPALVPTSQVPPYVIRLTSWLLARPAYIHDPTFIWKYDSSIGSKHKPEIGYVKFAAGNLGVVHVRDWTTPLYHRLVVATFGDQHGYPEGIACGTHYFPPGDEEYPKLIKRVKRRHYHNCENYELAFQALMRSGGNTYK